jgi:hypothetical protein
MKKWENIFCILSQRELPKTSTKRNSKIIFPKRKTVIIRRSTMRMNYFGSLQKYTNINYTINKRLYTKISVLHFHKESAFFQLYLISLSFALSLLS